MDNSILILLNINSIMYKLCIGNILKKNTIELHDMIIVYGLMTYIFNIDSYLEFINCNK